MIATFGRRIAHGILSMALLSTHPMSAERAERLTDYGELLIWAEAAETIGRPARGQNYGTNFDRTMPGNDAPLRQQVVKALKSALGKDFFLGGGGWGGLEDAFVPSKDSAAVYAQSALAVSISLSQDLGRYSSDRLLRCLACGVPTFVREFAGMSSWGLRHLDNCIVWPRTMTAAQAAEWIAHFKPADTIGQNGALLAQQHHTWEVRMRELAVYLAALRGVEITTEAL